MPQIPWREQAALIRTDERAICDGGRTIVAEASLDRVLTIAKTLPKAELERHFITLPDRRVPPFRYEAEAIQQLLDRPDRPGAFNGIGFARVR